MIPIGVKVRYDGNPTVPYVVIGYLWKQSLYYLIESSYGGIYSRRRIHAKWIERI